MSRKRQKTSHSNSVSIERFDLDSYFEEKNRKEREEYIEGYNEIATKFEKALNDRKNDNNSQRIVFDETFTYSSWGSGSSAWRTLPFMKHKGMVNFLADLKDQGYICKMEITDEFIGGYEDNESKTTVRIVCIIGADK